MTLAELLADLDELDDDLTIYTSVSPYAGLDSAAVVARDPKDGSIPAKAVTLGHFLDVSVAKRVIAMWMERHPGSAPSVRQMVDAVVHYAVHETYLPADEPAPASYSITLYRPVGPKELALIEASGWRRFPPRLEEQPIFKPVLIVRNHHRSRLECQCQRIRIRDAVRRPSRLPRRA